jgi:hypothetical protein
MARTRFNQPKAHLQAPRAYDIVHFTVEQLGGRMAEKRNDITNRVLLCYPLRH